MKIDIFFLKKEFETLYAIFSTWILEILYNVRSLIVVRIQFSFLNERRRIRCMDISSNFLWKFALYQVRNAYRPIWDNLWNYYHRTTPISLPRQNDRQKQPASLYRARHFTIPPRMFNRVISARHCMRICMNRIDSVTRENRKFFFNQTSPGWQRIF